MQEDNVGNSAAHARGWPGRTEKNLCLLKRLGLRRVDVHNTSGAAAVRQKLLLLLLFKHELVVLCLERRLVNCIWGIVPIAEVSGPRRALTRRRHPRQRHHSVCSRLVRGGSGRRRSQSQTVESSGVDFSDCVRPRAEGCTLELLHMELLRQGQRRRWRGRTGSSATAACKNRTRR